ncbi:hypothetical protein ACFSKW_26945 [Nonomuraea mangrovi]|uniref:Uncharacterized protein n=1 Tax=Nonomuraea mangrovi TaxID=2316207 RepID=A0ABW4SZN7_9ACTN
MIAGYPNGDVSLGLPRHQITVAAARGPSALAAEISRRLLPGYERDLVIVRQRQTRAAAERVGRAQLIARLVETLPGARVEEHDRRASVHWYGDGVSCTISTYGDGGSCRIEMNGIRSNTAERYGISKCRCPSIRSPVMTEISAEAWTTTVGLWVHYGQAYLIDDIDDAEGPADLTDDHPEHPVGIIRVGDDYAFLVTGTHTGTVSFSIAVAASEPAADLDGYEDVVEVSFESEGGSVSLHEWGGGNVHEIPELPAGPGWYRLRYHAAGMDHGHEGNEDGPAPDRYLLQIWPAGESDPVVVKSTSSMHRYWMTAG